MLVISDKISLSAIIEAASFILAIGVAWSTLKFKIDRTETNTTKSLNYMEETLSKINSTHAKDNILLNDKIKDFNMETDNHIKEFKIEMKENLNKLKNEIVVIKDDLTRNNEKELTKINNLVNNLEKEYKDNIKIVNSNINNSYSKLGILKENYTELHYDIKTILKYEINIIKKELKKIYKKFK